MIRVSRVGQAPTPVVHHSRGQGRIRVTIGAMVAGTGMVEFMVTFIVMVAGMGMVVSTVEVTVDVVDV